MTNGTHKKIQKFFLIGVFFWKRHLAKVPHWQFSKSQTYGPDKALQMREGAEKKLWRRRELSTLPLIGRRRRSEESLWEIRQLSPCATQLMVIFNTLVTEKNKREIQGDLGNWDCCTQTLSVVEGSRKMWKPSDNCSSQPSMVHWLSSSIFPCPVVWLFVPLWWHPPKSHF